MEVEIEQYRLKLQAFGWSQAALDKVFLAEMASLPHGSARQSLFEEAFIFGSPLFQKLWSFECRAVQPQQAENLLELAMLHMDMPDELSGEAAEITKLLSYRLPLSFGTSFLKRFGRLFLQQTLLHTVAIKG